MVGSVTAWLEENEECNAQGLHIVRVGKLNQLKSARKRTARTRGGPMAIMATLALLCADLKGTATLERTPMKGRLGQCL